MYFKIFTHGYDRENLLKFIEWWMRSEGWDKDIKTGETFKGGISIRDITRTILIKKEGILDLIIEKDFVQSDRPRGLKKGERYLNKGPVGGFIRASKKVETWLASRYDYDPREIDEKKAYEQGLRFGMVGIGFFVETIDVNFWKLKIHADVVGIPK